MHHELQIINDSSDSVWADFGYSDQEMLKRSKALGLAMIQHLRRDDVQTKTQAFAQALESNGEGIGLRLDTVNEYFILGATFAQTMLAMSRAERFARKVWVKTPLLLGVVLCAGIATTQLLTANPQWIGFACMALLLHVLRWQLTHVSLG